MALPENLWVVSRSTEGFGLLLQWFQEFRGVRNTGIGYPTGHRRQNRIVTSNQMGVGEPLRRRPRISPSPRRLRVDAGAEARGAEPLCRV